MLWPERLHFHVMHLWHSSSHARGASTRWNRGASAGNGHRRSRRRPNRLSPMTTWRGFRLSFSTRMGADAQAIVAPGGFAVDTRQPWPLCYDRGQSEGLAGSLLVWGTSAIFRARSLLIAESQPRGSSHSWCRADTRGCISTTSRPIWFGRRCSRLACDTFDLLSARYRAQKVSGLIDFSPLRG